MSCEHETDMKKIEKNFKFKLEYMLGKKEEKWKSEKHDLLFQIKALKRELRHQRQITGKWQRYAFKLQKGNKT